MDIEDDVDLQELVLNEKVVYVVPLAYCICATLAYWGPNAWIIGNIYNESWHFGRVEDFSQPVKIMAILFAIDIISIVLWYILLKIFCKISFYKAFMSIQKKFWLFMAIHEAFSLNEVSFTKLCILFDELRKNINSVMKNITLSISIFSTFIDNMVPKCTDGIDIHRNDWNFNKRVTNVLLAEKLLNF